MRRFLDKAASGGLQCLTELVEMTKDFLMEVP